MRTTLMVLILSATLLSSCNEKGAYEYVVTKKDGTKIKAWQAIPDNGMVSISEPWGNHVWYYIPVQDVQKIEYVGDKNINEDK